MSSLTDRIESDIKQAMKARDNAALTALRLLKTSLISRMIEKGVQDLDDKDVIGLIRKAVKLFGIRSKEK